MGYDILKLRVLNLAWKQIDDTKRSRSISWIVIAMKLMLHVREYREGRTYWNRHPTLEKHVAEIRTQDSTDDNMPDDLAEPAAPTAKGSDDESF